MNKFFDKAAYGDDWAELSRKCKERDNYTCRRCGYTHSTTRPRRQLHAHHIVSVFKGGPNKLVNLITICDDCHGREHKHLRKAQATKKKVHRISKVKRIRLL